MIRRNFLHGWHWGRFDEWVIIPTIAIRGMCFYMGGRCDVWVRIYWLKWTYRIGWVVTSSEKKRKENDLYEQQGGN